jgi:hypothetical protein
LGSRHNTKQRVDTPGPGAYEFQLEKSDKPAYTMNGRPATKIKSESPGPGAYSLAESTPSARKAPSYSIGGRSESKITSESPGPGAYQFQ